GNPLDDAQPAEAGLLPRTRAPGTVTAVASSRREPMALATHRIRQDKSFDQLTEAILARDQARTADLFYDMVRREGRPISEALGVVTAAEAPFVQVPSHINVRDRQTTLAGACAPRSPWRPRGRKRIGPSPSSRACGTSPPASTSGISSSAAIPAATRP